MVLINRDVAHLSKHSSDSRGRVDVQVLAHIAIAADLAAQQERWCVQGARAADHVLCPDDQLELGPSKGGGSDR